MTRPLKPGKVSRWWWDGKRWVPAGPGEQPAAGYWSPDPPWRWDGRQWNYSVGDGPEDLSELADPAPFTFSSLPATPPAPEVSDDGKFYWDGKRWVPIKESQPAVIRFGSSSQLPRRAEGQGMAKLRRPKWLTWPVISLTPLFVGVVGWASGQLWLAWLAIPLGVVAVLMVFWIATETTSPATAQSSVESPVPPPHESSLAACVGLAAADNDALAALVRAVAPLGAHLGQVARTTVVRWEDASGARLVLESTGDDLDFFPSFAGRVRARLREVRMLNDEVAMATVVDDQGEQLTSMAVVIEQRRLLPVDKPEDAMGSIVALGTSVSIHSGAEDFGESDASLFLGSEDAEHWHIHPDEPPARYVEQKSTWPRRMAAESFGSHAVFLEPAQARAFALMSGTVLSAERRTVVQTGQQILVVALRTAGFDLTMCLEGAAHAGLPPVGSVISGTVFMVASLGRWRDSAL